MCQTCTGAVEDPRHTPHCFADFDFVFDVFVLCSFPERGTLKESARFPGVKVPAKPWTEAKQHVKANTRKQQGFPARNCEFKLRKSQGSLVIFGLDIKMWWRHLVSSNHWYGFLDRMTVPLEFDFAQHFLPPQLGVIAAFQIAKAC